MAASPAARAPDRTGAHRNEPHSKSNEPCRTGHIQSQLPLAGSHLILAADASSHRLSLSGASPRASALSSLSPAPHLAPPCWSYSVSHSSAPVVCFSPPFPPPLVVAPPSLIVYVSLSLLLSHTRICIYLRTLNDASVSLGSYSDGRLQSGAPSHIRVRADDEPDTRPTIGEEGSALWLTTTKRRTSRTLLPKASRASASPATPISKHVFFPP